MEHPIIEMLSYRRPHGGSGERQFIERYIATLPGVAFDAFGNGIVRIPGNSHVLFSSHVDTVHRTDGRQTARMDGKGIVRLARSSKSNCLGADDAAGVYLMREMILAGIPGLYLFHRAEEKGGQGSDYIRSKAPEVIEGIQHAIAFDRAGTTDVITYQLYGKCASDGFAFALSDALGLRHAPADGTFTDTANYADIVSECTNLSVGYYHEHTRRECLDTRHLARMRTAVLQADWGSLPSFRDPSDIGFPYWGNAGEYGDIVWEPDTDLNSLQHTGSDHELLPQGGDGECESCGDYAPMYELTVEGWLFYACETCASAYYSEVGYDPTS